MRRRIHRDKIQKYLLLTVSFTVLLLLCVHFMLFFDKKYETASADEYERVKAYLVQCYATEGFYPPNLDYLEENYNLELRKDEFLYFYDAFSSNIMPDLIVSKQFKHEKYLVLGDE